MAMVEVVEDSRDTIEIVLTLNKMTRSSVPTGRTEVENSSCIAHGKQWEFKINDNGRELNCYFILKCSSSSNSLRYLKGTS